jgi:hypothetical protein
MGFVNKHWQKVVYFLTSFDAVFHTLSFGYAQDPEPVEGLKASPERRPEKAAVEVQRADCS